MGLLGAAVAAWLYSRGDMSNCTGTSPTTYDPSGNVTREQMAAFIGRLIRANGTA